MLPADTLADTKGTPQIVGSLATPSELLHREVPAGGGGDEADDILGRQQDAHELAATDRFEHR